ncbi:hypothetical protein MPH_13668 [Macrophomina phaseolina MS6]|uniref:Uncharacterized protein n=1 Tax=Macrophomina phaseolina (strain MS6) TaxID=1126212 RepID=K2R8V4_MACPH|nr:hypothetical protein MPH_13668 [Macrophomina phaseolina MS6]
MYDGPRNDQWLNNFNGVISLGWLANTDVSPCTGSQAVLNYIAKYCSKAETKSASYKDILAKVLPQVSTQYPLLSLVSKVMNRLLGERDWSAQEVSHLLLNLPLQQGSRNVLNVDCRPEHEQPVGFGIEGGETRHTKTLLQKFKERDQTIEWLRHLTYLDFLQNINFAGASSNRWTRRSRAKPRVLNYFPRYSPDPNGPDYEDWCRVKMMLHHDFSDLDALMSYHCPANSWSQAWNHCVQLHPRPYQPDYLNQLSLTAEDDEFELGEDDQELT